MVKTLARLECGELVAEKQDETQATVAPILTREDGAIDFARTPQQIYDRWRGFQPWPGAHTLLRGKKLIVHRMHALAERGIEPGVLQVRDLEMAAGCRGGAVVFDEVQMEGKRRMAAAEFLRGFQMRSGERLAL
jgi:methionyl-tRNA formyltransferase